MNAVVQLLLLVSKANASDEIKKKTGFNQNIKDS